MRQSFQKLKIILKHADTHGETRSFSVVEENVVSLYLKSVLRIHTTKVDNQRNGQNPAIRSSIMCVTFCPTVYSNDYIKKDTVA